MKSEERATKISPWRNGRKRARNSKLLDGIQRCTSAKSPKGGNNERNPRDPLSPEPWYFFRTTTGLLHSIWHFQTENAHLRSSLAFLENGESLGKTPGPGEKRVHAGSGICMQGVYICMQACERPAVQQRLSGEKSLVRSHTKTTDSKWQGVNQNRAGVYAGMQVAKRHAELVQMTPLMCACSLTLKCEHDWIARMSHTAIRKRTRRLVREGSLRSRTLHPAVLVCPL